MNLAYPSSDAFDVMPESTKIRGVEGTYQIVRFHKQRGIGRMYQAEKFPDGTPVALREYLLPPSFFNQTETHQRKQMFKALAGITLADGRSQDIRLLLPSEAIADPHQNRCYLITQGTLETYPSLKDYQLIHGAFGETAVREFLSQVLQTLEFLHGQKFLLPNGQLQDGVIHGNLTLDSLVLYPRSGLSVIPEEGDEASRFVSSIETGAFIIYLCDLSLWERVFDLAIAQATEPTPQDDLQPLGRLAFALLTGDRPHSETGEPLNPKHDDDWPPISSRFKQYLQRLMGLHSPYATAELARRDLLRLAPAPVLPVPIPPPPPHDDKKSGFSIPWRLMLLIMLLACLAQLLAWLLATLRARSGPLPQPLCCIADVAGVPSGTFTYTSESEGTWSYIRQEHLIEREKTLDQVLEERLAAPAENSSESGALVFNDVPDDPSTDFLQDREPEPITLRYDAQTSFELATQAVRQRRADFLMAGLTQPTEIDLAAETIAYDGLAAVVAFSYINRDQGLPSSLDGHISIRQLRQLYTGEITNWQELGGVNLPVQLYVPDSVETLRIVEDRILGDRQSIERFRQLLSDRHIIRLPTLEMLQQILQDFEDNGVGAIAFAPMSQVFGQCSVYPLAIQSHRQQSISPLVDRNGRAIRPSTDLCNAKGSYAQNTSAFRNQTYPLSYPVSVVYRRDNRLLPIGPKFAELLRTDESQRLLQQAGLVPLQPLPVVRPSTSDRVPATTATDQAPPPTGTADASPAT
ncbi:MAG: phosphate ABC transporter substrate-binding protein [Cyanobacteria bacterium P01_E01_bin.6]